jgi:hypothetical protein
MSARTSSGLVGRPDLGETLEDHLRVVVDALADRCPVAGVSPAPVVQTAISLALRPGVLFVDVSETPYLDGGREDDAHRLTSGVQNDAVRADRGKLLAFLFEELEQIGCGTFRAVEYESGELIGEPRVVLVTERPRRVGALGPGGGDELPPERCDGVAVGQPAAP